jgi:hypothetical protein
VSSNRHLYPTLSSLSNNFCRSQFRVPHICMGEAIDNGKLKLALTSVASIFQAEFSRYSSHLTMLALN